MIQNKLGSLTAKMKTQQGQSENQIEGEDQQKQCSNLGQQ